MEKQSTHQCFQKKFTKTILTSVIVQLNGETKDNNSIIVYSISLLNSTV